MNLNGVVSPMRRLAFQAWRSLTVIVPGGRICAFGGGIGQIGAIMVINLDRQPRRWQRVTRELGRFRTSEGAPLTSITRRLAAVDARDGRAAAATVDVDAMYRLGDHLHVQPDARLAECFADDEPVRMTRQEVAVARSHVEAWKAVSRGTEDYVLVLEDDVWFTPGAPAAIDRGWRAALRRCAVDSGPRLLYLSYADAGGTAVRDDPCDTLFRPVRGLWFLTCAGDPRQALGSAIVRVELRFGGGACARSVVRCLCARAPSLTSVHDPRVGSGAGDMMFDGVIPLVQALRPLGLSGPSTW